MDHETSKTLESTRNPDSRANFDEDSFCSMNVDLEFPSLVHGRVEKSKETLGNTQQKPSDVECFSEDLKANLMCDIWPCVTDISVHLAHDPNMLVAV